MFHSIGRQMLATLHHQQHAPELLKVQPFLRLERVLEKEWDDLRAQLLQPTDPIGHPIAMIASNDPAPEVGLQRMKDLHIALVLHDGEFRQNLVTARHVGMFCDADLEAAFTVHEACNPSWLKIHWPAPDVLVSEGSRGSREPSLRIVPMSGGLFLLGMTPTRTARLCEEFPAYSPVLLRLANP